MKKQAISLDALKNALNVVARNKKSIGLVGAGATATGVPMAAWYSQQAPSDPKAVDRGTGEAKVTNLDKWIGQRTLRKALKKIHKDPDVKVESGLHRVRIPKSKLRKEVLKYMDFAPSLVAVPERGQDKLTTYRQFDTAAHLHSHGKNWLLHQDKYPALTMAMKNPKNKGKMRKAIESGMKHVGLEGVGGYFDWLKNMVTGVPTMGERIDAMRDPKKFPKVVAWMKKKEKEELAKQREKKASSYEELNLRVGDATLTVEVADDEPKRVLGLSGREKLAEDRGMLFSPSGSYWMKDCNFDLDVMFIDKQAQVCDVQTMKHSDPYRVYTCRSEETPILAVEAPAGWCERNGVKIGDKIS